MPPFYFRHQVTPFVILFIERDGSTYLTSLLENHPEISMVYERFAVLKQKGQGSKDQLDWLGEFFSPPLISRTGAVGFKTKLVDVLDLDGFSTLIKQKKCKIILMQRKNLIKAVVSRINARRLYEATGNWNLYKETDRRPPMRIDLAEFDQFIKEREDAERDLREYSASLALPLLQIVYEDLLINKEQTLNQVLSFLKVSVQPLHEKTMKHTSDNLRDVIENFDEVQNHYTGTPYAAMFDEVLNPSA